MKPNQIIISGDTNQDFRTPEENESIYNLGKSIQLFFRQKLTNQFRELIAPVFDEMDKAEEAAKTVLFKNIGDDTDTPVKSARSSHEKVVAFLKKPGPNWFPKPISRFFETDEEERLRELENLKKFDRETYKRLYNYNFHWIERSIMEEGGDKQVARDVFQSALIILLERIKSDEFILTCETGTYLHSVAINIWRNLRKKLAERVIHIEILDFDDTLKETIYFEEIQDDYAKVATILEQMGDPCKSLLENFYFNQLSWGAIAEKMGYANAASARNQKYKCLEKIREIMAA